MSIVELEQKRDRMLRYMSIVTVLDNN